MFNVNQEATSNWAVKDEITGSKCSPDSVQLYSAGDDNVCIDVVFLYHGMAYNYALATVEVKEPLPSVELYSAKILFLLLGVKYGWSDTLII